MDKTHTEYIEENLPKLPQYNKLNKLDTINLYYRGIYELCLRNKRIISDIQRCIHLFSDYKIQNKYDKMRANLNGENNGEIFNLSKNRSCWFNLTTLLATLPFPIKEYGDSHIYLNTKINQNIFDVISYVYIKERERFSSGDKVHFNVINSLNMEIKLIHEEIYSDMFVKIFKYEITTIKSIEDIIHTEITTISLAEETSEREANIIFHEISSNIASLKAFLLTYKDTSSTVRTIKLNSNIYPILNKGNTSTVTLKIQEDLLLNKQTKKITQELMNTFSIDKILSEQNQSEAFAKLKNILKDSQKLIIFLYIYDSYNLFYETIKPELNALIKKEGSSVNKVSIHSLRLAISNITGYSTGNIKNYSSLINTIIDDELYLQV